MSSRISAHALPLMARIGPVLRLALQLTAGKSNGRAGLGYMTRELLGRLQSRTSKEQRDGAATRGPLMVQAAAMSASVDTLKPSFHVMLWPTGTGSGRLTQPTAL